MLQIRPLYLPQKQWWGLVLGSSGGSQVEWLMWKVLVRHPLRLGTSVLHDKDYGSNLYLSRNNSVVGT